MMVDFEDRDGLEIGGQPRFTSEDQADVAKLFVKIGTLLLRLESATGEEAIDLLERAHAEVLRIVGYAESHAFSDGVVVAKLGLSGAASSLCTAISSMHGTQLDGSRNDGICQQPDLELGALLSTRQAAVQVIMAAGDLLKG